MYVKGHILSEQYLKEMVREHIELLLADAGDFHTQVLWFSSDLKAQQDFCSFVWFFFLLFHGIVVHLCTVRLFFHFGIIFHNLALLYAKQGGCLVDEKAEILPASWCFSRGFPLLNWHSHVIAICHLPFLKPFGGMWGQYPIWD